MINVTKPYLPPLEEYIGYLQKIWQSCQLTNGGSLSSEFEQALKNYLATSYCLPLTNGTIALQLAIRALDLQGEIITTPFSYVATVSSIVWEKCTPIFVDIEPDTLTINTNLIQNQITEKTSAILVSHVYGNPCDVEAIQKIAQENQLKVIYDAAQAFGVKYKNIPLTNYGDISALSFHATKIFNTGEGGAIVTANKDIAHTVSSMKNFGYEEGGIISSLGINGKISELHCALGLCNLKVIEKLIAQRKIITELYDQILIGQNIRKPTIRPDTEYNYCYYPIILDNEETLNKTIELLEKNDIKPRRYFYPSLNLLPYVRNNVSCPISEDISKKILCLPLYSDLAKGDAIKIAKLVLQTL